MRGSRLGGRRLWSWIGVLGLSCGRHGVDVLALATFLSSRENIKREYKPEEHAVIVYLFTIFSSEGWLIRGRGPGREISFVRIVRTISGFLGFRRVVRSTNPDNL
jgi:hypothetical protein